MLRQGGERLLRSLRRPALSRRGEAAPRPIATAANDTIREELEEFAACIRTGRKPETDGGGPRENLAVLTAGIQSAREDRAVDVELVAAG